jgi:hypothetical protein
MAVAVNHTSFLRPAFCMLGCLLVVTLSGCATMEGLFSEGPFGGPPSHLSAPRQPEYRTPDQAAQPIDSDQKAVLASARTLIGLAPESRVNVNGRTFVLDCIGTVSAIFYGIDIDVQRDFRRYSGDGVNRLYQSLKALNTLHKDLYPRPGDVIFWDNTWDANGDGILTDDPRTHAGVVLSVDKDGTIHYVHEHIIKGVTIEAMNLLHPRDYYDPQGRIINNALAMNSGISRKNNPPHWTSGDLWDSFGDILRVRKHFEVADTPSDLGPSEESVLAMRPPDQW